MGFSKIGATIRTSLCILAVSGVTGQVAAETLRIGGTGVALAGMKMIGAAFTKAHPDIRIEVLPSLGSGGGIKALVAGAIDLSVSSRPLKDAEAAKGLTAHRYARTPLAIVAHPSVPIEGLSAQELADIYIGRTTVWPDGGPVRIVLRPAVETDTKLLRNLSPIMSEAVDTALNRNGLLTASNDQENASAIERTPGSLGVVAVGQLTCERRDLKILAFNGVRPTVETAADENYGFVKDLRLVIRDDASPAARKFLAYLTSEAGRRAMQDHWYPIAD